MSFIFVSERFVRLGLVAAAFAVGSAIRLPAYVIDQYGRSHVTPRDMQDAANAQSRASADAYRKNSQRPTGPVEKGPFDLWLLELQAKENARLEAARTAQEKQAEAVRQEEAREQAALEARRRQERDDVQMVVIDGVSMTGKQARLRRDAEIVRLATAKWAADKAAFEKVFGSLIRTTNAALEARRTGTPFVAPADAEPIAKGMVMDYYEDKRVTSLNEIRCTSEELFALGMDIYRQCDLSKISLTGISCTAVALAGRGQILVDRFLAQCADRNHPANGTGNQGAYGFHEGWTMLACALATPDGKLDSEQRRLAAALLAEVINGRLVDDYPDAFARAEGSLFVAAARHTPELLQIPKIQQHFIPMVNKSAWGAAFSSRLLPAAAATPLIPTDLRSKVWLGLATRLVLSDQTAYPGLWFAQVRAVLNGKTGGTLSVVARQTLQQALDGWCNRAHASPWLRQALQADFDLTCSMPEGKIAENDPRSADLKKWWYWDNLIRNHDEATLAGNMIQRLATEDPFHSGVTGFLLHAGAPAIERYIVAVTTAVKGKPDSLATWAAIQGLTNLRTADGAKLPDLGVLPATWRKLVIAGEASRRLNARLKWNDPLRGEAPTMARIQRIRQEILGESAEELKLPEYSREPADLRESLLLLTENGLGAEARPVVKSLLEQNREVIDPATVLTVAQVLGPKLGDWVKLATWLDDPRRRPKDDQDPLHAIFVAAILERDMVAGSLASIPFGPRADAESCQQFQDWLVAVLAATGVERKKLIDDHFPAVIYCPDAASAYPDLRMVGYDIAQGGFASRALLLLSSEEFNPEWQILNGYAIIDGEDGKAERIGGPDLEPWLAAVAKLPRTVTPEVLLAEISAGVKARRDYLAAKVAALATPPPETAPRELTEEEASALILKAERGDNDSRTRWVADGCQEALVRLANRWSPARVPAQAAVLALGDQVLLDDEGIVKANPACIAARVAWEQAKMQGLDDAAAFKMATAKFPRDELRTLATLAEVKARPHPLLLWNDEHFAREAVAAGL